MEGRSKKTILILVILLFIFPFISGCISGDRGRPGTAGTPGATGPAGAGNMTMNMTANMTAGPPGAPGADGADGADGAPGAPGPNNDPWYYWVNTTRALTGQEIFRDVSNSNLNLFGGTNAAGKGGIVSVQGKDLAANDAIVFYVPDMTYTANLIAAKFKGGVAQPYLSMNTRQIKDMADPVANQDAATKKYVDDATGGAAVWADYVPVLTWETGTPAGITTVARYIKVGKVVTFTIEIVSADSNGATGLTISLPEAPANNANRIAVTSIQRVGGT